MTTADRQDNVDTTSGPIRCHYAGDPVKRPHCQLTAAVRYGPISLCASCERQRSTLGKAHTATRLSDSPPVDVLDWVTAARTDLRTAERQVAVAVHRARQQGHSWSTLGNLLGTTRQAAQQRFRQQTPQPSTADTREP